MSSVSLVAFDCNLQLFRVRELLLLTLKRVQIFDVPVKIVKNSFVYICTVLCKPTERPGNNTPVLAAA